MIAAAGYCFILSSCQWFYCLLMPGAGAAFLVSVSPSDSGACLVSAGASVRPLRPLRPANHLTRPGPWGPRTLRPGRGLQRHCQHQHGATAGYSQNSQI